MERIAVSLVGAGPGDPELLTLKAAERLRMGDVIYHDALVSADILCLCREDARIVPVGKRRGFITLPQEGIIAAMIHDASQGRAVVRLKGGDPFIFGRGGEEALALARAGIPFEIVPGVSSGTGVPALAGIPLTHRGLSGSAAFVTAHDLSPKAGRIRQRLKHLARGADTLVVFMAMAEVRRVKETLLAAGLSAETPVALIESGSTPRQNVQRAVLGELDALKASWGRRRGPVLLVIGKTVALSGELLARQLPLPAAEEWGRRAV